MSEKKVKYILEESNRFPKPAHVHLGLSTVEKRIDKRLLKGLCKGGSCYECNNLSCQRDHDAWIWWWNRLFEQLDEQLEGMK